MKKFLSGFGLIILLIVLFYFIMTSLANKVGDYERQIKAKVGCKIVIEKDTLLILDYSLLQGNYTLSDGRQVSFELAEKLTLLE